MLIKNFNYSALYIIYYRKGKREKEKEGEERKRRMFTYFWNLFLQAFNNDK